MRITIDSTEPLQDVLRAVGAVYDVTLTVAEPTEALKTETAAPAPSPERPARTRAARGTGSRGRSRARDRSAQRSQRASTTEMRTWARENGHTVRDSGRIPASIVAAYEQAHGG